MLMAGTAACIEIDVKKIVALSTLSQLGVMMISLSLYQKDMCFFHLIVHAMFKALLFIRVGVVIHILYGSQEFRSFNNLRKMVILPVRLLSISRIALIGFPFLSGFYRKDMIMERFYSSYNRYLMGILFLVGVGLTAAYRIKIIRLACLRNKRALPVRMIRGGIRWEVKIPLLVLGMFSILGGQILGNKILVFIRINRLDKMIPLIFIIIGLILGLGLDKVKRKRFRSILILVPLFQKMRSGRMKRNILVKADKEFIEVGPNTLGVFKNFIVIFHPIISVSLLLVFVCFF